jgi:hypothetical protein
MTSTFFNNPQSCVKVMDWEVGSSGYAAVWAKENTARSSGTPCSAARPIPPPVRA